MIRKVMRFFLLFQTSVFICLFPLVCPSQAVQIKFKLGTLGPKGTSVTSGVDILVESYLDRLAKSLGHSVSYIGYYGGVMGDDPQMMQKAQMGQLDIVTPTINGLPQISKEIEVLYMAYLIDEYGKLDYVSRKFFKDYQDILWGKGWLSINGLISEGYHELYMKGPWRTPEQLKKNLTACNYTGGPDDTFFKALGIPQVPIMPPEMFSSFKADLSNAVILPSTFVIGMQIYSALPYIMRPAVRTSVSGVLITKAKFESLPWDFKVSFVPAIPLIWHWSAMFMRDGAEAYTNAMVKYGSKIVTLTPSELKAIRDPVVAYRETYLGNDTVKRSRYEKVIGTLREYDGGNPIEKAMYKEDPYCVHFPKKIKRLAQAIKSYVNSGSKAELGRLEEENVLPKWILYDFVEACEKDIEAKGHANLKAWMEGSLPQALVDEMFTKHQGDLDKVFGTKAKLATWLNMSITFLEDPRYKGYQEPVK